MQSILRWSIEHSSPADGGPTDNPPRRDLDPGVLDFILGKPDSEQMKEDMAAATDENRSEEERVAALDHLEMLIENIDNANDLDKLKLWAPLHSLLTADASTPEIKTQVLWVIGTALQNNPSSQEAYLTHNPLPTLVAFLDHSPSTSTSLRAKAVYALSGLLKHNAPAVRALGSPDIDGWTKLRTALQDPSISVRRKVVFLLGSLLQPISPVNSPATSPTPAPPDAPRLTFEPSVASSTSATSPEAPNILTPDRRHASAADNPIFDNSHAANLQDPSRPSTSSWTVSAIVQHGILDAVVAALVAPVPYGEDGENAGPDADFEEKAVQLLYTYTATCKGPLFKKQKEQIMSWIQAQKEKEGENQLLEQWNMTREEYAAFAGKLL